jgi:hypothetical protein
MGELVIAPSAPAFGAGSLLPAGLLGLPSLHGIVEAIAKGFFGALAGALVPSWLKHGSVATIQHLVALPDPASWSHVSALQGEMTYLGAMLLPVTLAVGATRYWLIGLSGAAHPAGAIVRCAAVSGVLVAYRWIVEQAVAGTNTLTHGILGLPSVGNGLQQIVGVLFGGALLSGTGGVFGAFLVIVGVVFAAGLFAAQVLLTVVLAVLIVAGPPVIAISAIPELSHLSRSWAHALLSVALVPLGWTVLFATAGALCLDATSFTGAGGRVPGHVAAAFAGLITFVIAARLPLIALGEIRHLFSAQGAGGQAGGSSSGPLPTGNPVRAAHARLRAVGLQGVPSLGASAGRAAGALGAPAGGPAGAVSRRLSAAARRTGIFPGALGGAGLAVGAVTGARPGTRERPRGARSRLAHAREILNNAPSEAVSAAGASYRRARRAAPEPASAARRAAAGAATTPKAGESASGSRAPAGAPRKPGGAAKGSPASPCVMSIRAAAVTQAPRSRATSTAGLSPLSRAPVPAPNRGAPGTADTQSKPARTPPPPRPPEMHPAREQASRQRQEAPRPSASTPPDRPRVPRGRASSTPARATPTRRVAEPVRRAAVKRKPKPRGRP